MKAVVRGAAVAAVLALTVTACGEGNSTAGSTAAGSAGAGTTAAGSTAAGSAGTSPAWIDATGLFSALPVESGVGDIFVGDDAAVIQDGEALAECSKETKSSCAGIQAAGKKEMEARGSDETRLEFTLFTFATTDQAAGTMRDLAEQRRKKSAENGTAPQPLTIDSGADETEAMRDGDRCHIVMRIGTVVSHVYTNGAQDGNVEHAVKVQVARVKSVAAGINPDR
ncbi:hypothetical protein [Streptomyces sp. NPDC051909]|uniref:hypothetical protein n=1 Tax=Streptomyces sp. NPDC051909 TaxID=3154944 RepID=UPI0034344241